MNKKAFKSISLFLLIGRSKLNKINFLHNLPNNYSSKTLTNMI